MMWKWLAKLVLGKVHVAIDRLSDADLQEAADYINKKIGGNKKVEFESLKIIVTVVQHLLDVVTI